MKIEEMKESINMVLNEYMAVREAYYKEPTNSPRLKELEAEWVRLENKLYNLKCKIRYKKWKEHKERYGC